MSVLDVQVTTTGIVPNTSGLGIGMTQQLPVQIYITTNDTLATVTTAGYLNDSVTHFKYPYNNYQMALVYTTDVGCTWLRVTATVSGSVTTYSLVTPTEGSGTFTTVLLGNGSAAAPSLAFSSDTGTGWYRSASHVLGFAVNGSSVGTWSATALTVAAGNFAVSSGTIISSGTIQSTTGNLVAGSSGHAGTVTSFPGTAANGSLVLAAVNNAGNFNATISNIGTLAQSTVYTLADPTSATATIPVSTTASTIKIVSKAAVAGGAAAQTVTDTAVTASSVVIANWNDTTVAVEIQKVTPGAGSFVVTSTADPGASHISYVVYN